jgi:transcriptional regulator with XRE-family HTH domain
MQKLMSRITMAEKDFPAIARKVKALRQSLGLSQQELATRAGLSISIVARVEQAGKKVDLRISTMASLARVLGVTLDELASDEPLKKRRKPKK